ncbi:nitrile hydratase accessory protein [Gymnodinialimonas sp. 2305UL16-5]|uniref:nitrile hydratase accessory protein n=1 Tax=Gymnodinialimonas mytili TaxID=3126503 RepID=UPI0030A8E50F
MEPGKDAPVFEEPWQAQAFAMVVDLHAKGAFTWTEWAEALSAQVHSGIDRDYYHHWLAALEQIVAAKGLTASQDLDQRRQEWLDAAARTPHGDPIIL